MNTVRRLQAGFTLIEILIVIAIIGVMAAAVMAAINPIQQLKKARDAQRLANAKQVQTAMEQYFANSGSYTCNEASLKPFLPNGLPLDPSTKVAIGCAIPDPSTGVASSYCVTATPMELNGGNCNSDCTAGSGTSFYCVKNLQ